MEQIIEQAKKVFESRNLKTEQVEKNKRDELELENNRMEKEAKEVVKLVIQLFEASNQEDGDYRIDDINIGKTKKNENLFCRVTFEKDICKEQIFNGYYELINLPYISKAIDAINHKKFDPKVLYKVMNIIYELQDYNIISWSSGEYRNMDGYAESLTVSI